MLNVLFIGSGELGLPAMRSIAAAPELRLVAVVTQPDQPAGRSRAMTPTPAATAASAIGCPKIIRAPDVNSPALAEELAALAPDVAVVASFGQILRPRLLALPRLGCVNVHASLLPRLRGASPIQAAILQGDSLSGITFMLMDEGLDTGPILQAFPEAVRPDDTAATLGARLADLAGRHVRQILADFADGRLRPQAQDHSAATYAGKLRKQDGDIDWSEPAGLIARKCRAYQPWPELAFAMRAANGKTIYAKLLQAAPLPASTANATPGTILQADRQAFRVACGDGELLIQRLAPAGKKPMSAADFLLGTRLVAGEIMPPPRTAETQKT